MKVLRAFYEFLKNPAVETGLAICGVIISLFSPKEYLILDISIIAILFTLIVIGQLDEKKQSQIKHSQNKPDIVVSGLGKLSRNGAPLISFALIAILIIGVADGVLDKGNKIHAFFFQSWADEIDIVPTPGEIHLLSVAPDGPIHDLFSKSKPVLTFTEDTSTVLLSFEYFEEINTDSGGDWDIPSYLGVGIALMGKDPTNTIYEPVDRYFESNYIIKDYSLSGFAQYQIVEQNTVFIRLSENKFARMHFADFEYDVYGNLVKIKLFVAYKNNGSAHFERLTTP